jgi:hypothetical protein
MASKAFIDWAKSQKYKPGDEITNWQKLTSPYILSEYKTWGEVYAAAVPDVKSDKESTKESTKETKVDSPKSKNFKEKQKQINALQSIPQMEQDAAYYKDEAESVNNTPAEREDARKKYESLEKEISDAQEVSGKSAEKLEKGAAKESAADLKKEYAKLKERKDVLLDPTDPEGRGPIIQKKMDEILKKFQDSYSIEIGTRVSTTVAKSKILDQDIPTFSSTQDAQAEVTATGAETPGKVTKPVSTTTPGAATTPGAITTPKPKPGAKVTPDVKVETPAEKEAGALGAAMEATDLVISETLFKNIPSLNSILKKYVNTPGMTEAAFLKLVRNDVWYKQNSKEIRGRYTQYYNYRDLQASGRTTGSSDYEKQISTIEAKLKKRATTIGSAAANDPAALRKAAENLYITNRSEDESFITDFLSASIKPIAGMIGGKVTQGYSGEALTNYDKLVKAARDNGFQVSDILPGGANVDQVLSGITSGKIDVNRVIADAGKLAAQGQPQYVRDLIAQGYTLAQVFKPYRQTMATILEIGDPEQIDLNDPLLRSSITDKGDMNLYDFKKALRQDNRWQYTEQAKQDVSNAAFNVLRDFGFQG